MIARRVISVKVISVTRKLGQREIVVIAGDFNDHVGSNLEGYDDQHAGNGYGVRNRKGKGFLSFA